MSEDSYLPYEKDHEQMILRDYLAVDRTLMTNETAFMSYIRTSLTLIAAGATLMKIFSSEFSMQVLGWAFILIGGWLAVHGYNRFRKTDEILHKVKGETMHRAAKLKKSKIGASLKMILGRSPAK
ncbi:MAG TPA: DUF202 domain-containing protein [Patescibacteria group bacterium]|nr:DUF202 domain-containing protein [Patescibacteria group bacterium]